MAVKAIIKITDRDKEGNLVEYSPGAKLNLSKEEEKRLVELGFAEPVKGASNNSTAQLNNGGDNNLNGQSGDNVEGPNTGYPGEV